MKLLTPEEICERYGISLHQLQRLKEQGLPYIEINKRTHRFDPEQTDAWMRQRAKNKDAKIVLLDPQNKRRRRN